MLILNEDQRLLLDSARAGIADRSPVSENRRLREPQGPGYDPGFWAFCGEMGFAGVLAPEAQGGAGFGAVGAGIIAREMGRHLVLAPFLSTAVLAATALAEGGSAAQQAQCWPRIAGGEAVLALAHEGRVEARREGAGWRLQGEAHFVLDGHVAEAFVVAAGDELFLVPAQGLSRQTRILVDGRRVASLRFDGLEVAGDAKLPGGALPRTLEVGAAVLAASLCGVAEEALRRTLDYLKERRQFDKRIGSFQALQHRAALAHIAVENAWSATLLALQSLDARANSAALDVAVAKSKASRTAEEVTAEALQMHGGIGMTDAFDIGLYLKRARVEATLLGDAAHHAGRVASLLGY